MVNTMDVDRCGTCLPPCVLLCLQNQPKGGIRDLLRSTMELTSMQARTRAEKKTCSMVCTGRKEDPCRKGSTKNSHITSSPCQAIHRLPRRFALEKPPALAGSMLGQPSFRFAQASRIRKLLSRFSTRESWFPCNLVSVRGPKAFASSSKERKKEHK